MSDLESGISEVIKDEEIGQLFSNENNFVEVKTEGYFTLDVTMRKKMMGAMIVLCFYILCIIFYNQVNK